MRKKKELKDPNSCLSKAKNDEFVFVLLGRDAAAPETIRFWCRLRIRLGKNAPDDEQITSALADADAIEREQRG